MASISLVGTSSPSEVLERLIPDLKSSDACNQDGFMTLFYHDQHRPHFCSSWVEIIRAPQNLYIVLVPTSSRRQSLVNAAEHVPSHLLRLAHISARRARNGFFIESE